MQSSFPLHLPTFPKLFVLMGAGKETQPKPLPLAGSLRDGEKNKSYITPSIEEYYYIWNKTSTSTDNNVQCWDVILGLAYQ